MNKITKQQIHGFFPAVATPFDADGNILIDDFAVMVKWLVSSGADGICVAGDNGESWALDASERGVLVEKARASMNADLPVVAGCSAPTLSSSIDYALAAKNNGADALLMMPPTYVLRGSRDEILRRFSEVHDRVGLPLLIYNSPRRVGYSLSLDDIEAIMGVSNVIGIKESHRDFFHHTHLLERFANRMSIMVGPCHYILPAMALGAKGFIATGPELLDGTARKIVQLASGAPDDEYIRTHMKLTKIYELLMGTGTWPSSFKAALEIKGLPAGFPRDPVCRFPQANALKLPWPCAL